MPRRPISVLFVLLLAGCASSEPENVSYAPLATAPVPQAVQTAPTQVPQAAPPPSLQAAAPAVPMAPAQPELPDQPAALPPPDMAGLPATETQPAANLPPGATNCSTVDGVTLCDAAVDPNEPDKLDTN